MPTNGDFYAGKGIGQAVLQTSAGLLSVFNTHTCANYSHKYKGDNTSMSYIFWEPFFLAFWHKGLQRFMIYAPSLLAAYSSCGSLQLLCTAFFTAFTSHGKLVSQRLLVCFCWLLKANHAVALPQLSSTY